MLKTTSDLLASVNRRGFWSASNGPYTDADILAIATEEIQGPIFTMFESAGSDIYAAFTDVTMDGSVKYRIPADAGYRLRDVLFVDSLGQEHQLDVMLKDKLGYRDTIKTDVPRCYYMDGHQIGLWPTPPSTLSGSVRFKYYWQPNTLVSGGTTIGLIDSGAAYVTPAAAVSGWTTNVGATWDVLSDSGAHGLIDQFTGTYGTSPLDITSVVGDDAGNRVGDILAQTGETHVPQVPTEAFFFLAQSVLVRCLAGHSDKRVLAEQGGYAAMLESRLQALLERRVEGESPIYVPDTTPLGQL